MVRLPILTTARCALLLRKNFSYVYGFLFVQPFKVSIQAGSDVHSFDHVTCVLFVLFFGSEFCFIWFLVVYHAYHISSISEIEYNLFNSVCAQLFCYIF